jgi:hypothetical protein
VYLKLNGLGSKFGKKAGSKKGNKRVKEKGEERREMIVPCIESCDRFLSYQSNLHSTGTYITCEAVASTCRSSDGW